MRIKIFLLITAISAIGISSCNNVPSYADLKREEKKAIDKLIAEEGFEILKKYPADGVFGEKQFVVLDNGVYLNVVDSGNGRRAVEGRTTILMRCSVRLIFKTDTAAYSNFSNIDIPVEFMYGYASNTISEQAASYSDVWLYLSTGVESILKYVGENSVVKLIVPFDYGSSYQSTGLNGSSSRYGAPLYYDKVRFAFY